MASQHIFIGPDGNQWIFDTASRSYDLTRGSQHKLVIHTSRGAEVSSILVDPEKSALIIVDMQNFFLHPDCRDNPTGLSTIDPILNVIEKCRAVHMQIIWLNWSLTAEDLAQVPANNLRNVVRRQLLGAEAFPAYGEDLGKGHGRALMTGALNTEIYAPLKAVVRTEDIHCGKNRFSGLWNDEQSLSKHLRDSGKKTLFFAGINTDRCVLGTMADASYAGWDCIAIEDACATASHEAHEICVANIELIHGFVVNSETFCAGQLKALTKAD